MPSDLVRPERTTENHYKEADSTAEDRVSFGSQQRKDSEL